MMGESKFLLGIVRAIVGVVVLPSLHHFLFLLCFPLLVELFLLVGEQWHELSVGILEYAAAGAAVGFWVTGGVVAEAVHGYRLGNENDLDLKYLILSEVELIFEHAQEPGGSFCGVGFECSLLEGGVGCLGVYEGMEAGDEQD
jgi:hypothetical protein